MRSAQVLRWFFTVVFFAAFFVASMHFQGLLVRIFGSIQLVPTVDVVYLPSGVRLVAGLVAGVAGVLGIFFGTIFVNLTSGPLQPVSLPALLLVSLPGALSPLAALWYGRWLLKIERDLSNIRLPAITHLAAVYSLLSSTGHQALFILTGAAESSLLDWLGMFIGDLVGAMLCLALLAALMLGIRRLASAPGA